MVSIKEKKTVDWKYLSLIFICFGSLLLFQIAGTLEIYIYRVIGDITFLTYHMILEFISVVICFAAFTITYYTYLKNHRLRLLIFSSVFFITGWLDFFHAMGYNGMPVFFTDSSIAKATTFWIIGRLVFAIGLLTAGIIKYYRKATWSRVYFLWGSIVLAVAISYMVTNHLGLFPPLFIEGQGLTNIKIYLEYVIMLVFVIATAFYVRDYYTTKDKVFIIMAAGLLVSAFAEVAFTLYRSVYDIYNFLGHLYKIAGIYLISRAIFIYNLDKPYMDLQNAKKKIKIHAENLEKIVERRTSEIQKVNEKMIQDLEYAKKIQESLLPPKELKIFGVQFISEYIPCERLSGDFYGIYVIDEENIGMYIADVAGHGVSAAMMTVFADRVIKPTGLQERTLSIEAPHKTLDHFYREFNKSQFPIEMHVVIFHAIYNIRNKILSYCSGGMNVLPIVVRKNGEVTTLKESTGFPICRFGDLFIPEYKKGDIRLDKGDRVIFYTDGLVESFKNNTPFEQKRLIQLLLENREETLEDTNKKILEQIQRAGLEVKYDDDVTYFIMEA
ncbi:Phosphoserine phosphatase RsbP [Thermotalea metallivorans]|uniref:Phosphoserine phosphatase RsbP n=1 Tax=Thermotalea metallivorans TaxID=520762 RepID=A0A140LEI4_9FIRM|nr:Phosphoserine phosphatase RsbP [Thermotalea metallivorans]